MLAIVLTIFSACQKDQLAVEQPQTVASVQEKPDVYVENGIIDFVNQQTLSSTLKEISQMSENERKLWELRHGFTSQLSIFNSIINEELKLDEPYQNMSEEELEHATPPPSHSEAYYEYIKKGVIKEFKLADGSTM